MLWTAGGFSKTEREWVPYKHIYVHILS